MFKKLTIIASTAFAILATSPSVKSDDTEIYFGQTAAANVLLVLDTSGSMNTEDVVCKDSNGASYSCSRLQALKDGVSTFLANVEDNVRVGIMRFPAQLSGKTVLGGELLFEVAVVGETALGETESNRDRMAKIVNDLTAQGGTPLTQSFMQAVNYFSGDYKALSSSVDKTLIYDEKVLTTGEVRKGLTWKQSFPIYNGDAFDTPIKAQCSIKNKVVLLTDGQPNSMHSDTKDDINGIINEVCSTTDENDVSTYRTRINGRIVTVRATEREIFSGEDCAVKLASYISSNKLIDAIDDSSVSVDTLGFALDNDGPKNYLQAVADAGKGVAYVASDAETLANAFNASLASVTETSSFVAPSVPLSQSNRLSSGNELYLAMFKPEGNQLWHGNLKKYFLKNGNIVDKNGNLAVNDKGRFFNSASSAWSTADGDVVELGGAAQAMGMPRTVYSHILNKNLWTEKNQIKTDNNKITKELLGLSSSDSDTTLQEHITWIYNEKVGHDVNGDGIDDISINRFADPLHSKPVLVRYTNGEVVFVGSNEGYLHAINPANDSGDELWSFMPRQLLKNVSQLVQNKGLVSSASRIYGLDGDITVYHQDKNRDGIIDNGEKAYLYVGMRRGGKNYYAIDISDKDKPDVMFTITGDRATADEIVGDLSWDKVEYYPGLAETWSKPIVGNIKWNGQKKLVMIFGGGYDSKVQDDASKEAGTMDDEGNNIFIADAVTGQMLWNARDNAIHKRAGTMKSVLTNSFAADLSAGDLTGSGTIEHIFAADTGGQVFRFDIVHADNVSSIQGAKIADIQGSGKSGNRRFMNKPDVSFVKIQGQTMAMIALGTGYRAHPLNEDTSDRFYVFYDKKVMSKTFETTSMTESSLFDITQKITDENGKKRLANVFDIFKAKKQGWYLKLAKGEKVLSDSTTINYRSFFTTYTPTNDPTSCDISIGSNKLYGISILDGRPAFSEFDNNDNGLLDEIDERYTDVNYVGIAPGFTVLFPDNSNGNTTSIVSFVGAEQICSGNKCDFANELQTVKWRELTDSELNKIKND